MNLEEAWKKVPLAIRGKFLYAASLFSKAKQFAQNNQWNKANIYLRLAKKEALSVAANLAKAFGGAEKVPKEIRTFVLNLIKYIEELEHLPTMEKLKKLGI